MNNKKVNKLCLVVIDGWGHSESHNGNSIQNSKCDTMKKLSQTEHSYLIKAHGKYVGLPENQMGNSETGHLTIGSGRVILQDILRIKRAIEESKLGEILEQSNITNMENVHLVGLVSDGGVHSHIDILKSILLNLKNKVSTSHLHFISDGRDTEPRSFERYRDDITKFMTRINYCSIGSVSGRYYSMDRNDNVKRIEMAFAGMTHYSSFGDVNLRNIKSDEMIEPVLLRPCAVIKEGDPILFFNFRADRMRQLVKRFIGRNPIFTLTDYDPTFTQDKNVKVLFPQIKVKNTLSDVIAQAKMTQSHIAETEKYAHVTYFFDGGNEEKHDREYRIMVDSPGVCNYAETPGMSMEGVVEQVQNEMEKKINFIVCNLAAPDMIGHTGNYNATKKAVEYTDESINAIYMASIDYGYKLVITADHGNCEVMLEEDGRPRTAHTTNPVPFVIVDSVGDAEWGYKQSDYSLEDVAPTILDLMGLDKPDEMTGISMIRK